MGLSTSVMKRLYTTSCIAYAQTINYPSIQQTQNLSPINMLGVNSKLKELVKSGRLNDARRLFDELPHRDEVSWTTIISGYVKASDSSEALSLFSDLWVVPSRQMDPFVLSLALKACGLGYNVNQGESLHGYCVKSDFVSSVFVGSSLVDMYMKMGKVCEGCRVFDEMPTRNVVSWTAVITGLVRAGFNKEGLLYFADLCGNSMEFDSFTVAIALKACADSGLLRYGREIHNQALKKGFDTTSFVANTLVTMYNKCGKGEYALYLFDKIKTKDVVPWTTIITAYVQTGQEKRAIDAFLQMRESEVTPNEFTFAAVISGCANIARIDLGEQFHAHVLQCGFMGCMSVANSVMTLYSKCGKLHSASMVFQELSQKDIVSWSTIIGGHAQGDRGEEAFRYLFQMRKEGPKPTEFAFASVLSVCGTMAILEQGKQLHAHVLSVGLDHRAMVRSGLINMYSKCGSIREASKVFYEAENNDLVSWTAMINGYAEHGLSQEAINLFEKLPEVGLRPDGVTFIGVLTACSHAGFVDLGFHYFNLIKEYEITLRKEHYGCMVDLLCRAGRLREAERMINDMPWRPHDVVWSTLLRACRIHGDVECGRRAAEKILETDPNCPATHVTLANLYSARGKWREAAEMRMLMRTKGVTKETGWSWIKVKDSVSAFASGDRKHPLWEDIYHVLDLLASSEEVLGSGICLLPENIEEEQ